MKKKIIRFLSVVLAATMVTGFPVYAESYRNTKGFTEAWDAADSSPNWRIEYGYNTRFINEDYTHTLHFSKNHTAMVSNANGSFARSNNPGQWAIIEVTHSGNSVTYSIAY